MSWNEFSENDHGFGSATEDELDAIALKRGGVLGGHSQGYSLNPSRGLTAHGYELVVSGTQGCGNCCILTLKGLTPQKRALLRQGRVEKLVREGFSAEEAGRFLCSRTQYKWELRSRLLAALRGGEKIQADILGLDEGHRGAYIASLCLPEGHPLRGISCPRASALSGLLSDVLEQNAREAAEMEVVRRAAAEEQKAAEARRLRGEQVMDRRLRAMGYIV